MAFLLTFPAAKNDPIKDVGVKRQITAFAISATGKFLPVQLIYPSKTKRCLKNFRFPRTFRITYTENHRSNQTKALQHLGKVIFPYLEQINLRKCYLKEQMSLVIMDTFKRQDKDKIRTFCVKKSCEIVIIPHNLMNKFQPSDISVSKAAKSFVSDKYNSWIVNEVLKQLRAGKTAQDVKVSL